MFGIVNYLWRLIPGNPILLRVLEAGGRRRRDLLIRSGYLGVLVGWVILSLLSSGRAPGSGGIAELTRTSFRLFQSMSYLQLGLVALLAPVFTAGAITQEKDAQTYDILLSTPLTNAQIVLGSLVSRLFFVITLLISGIPVFSITQIFGGVAVSWIFTSFLIAAATAILAGALSTAIATFKVGTRRTIFGFYFVIVLYLVAVALLDRLPTFKPVLVDGTRAGTGWLTAIHPFLALRTLFGSASYTPPSLAELPTNLRGFVSGWMLTRPASFFITASVVLSGVLVLPSILVLRRIAQSTATLTQWLLTTLRVSKGDKTRRPRGVWNNPIAWREARTKASTSHGMLLRGLFAAGVLTAAGSVLLMLGSSREPDRYATRSSYNPVERTFTVYTPDTATSYSVAKTVPLTLDGIERPLSAITQRVGVSVTANGKDLTTITATSIPGRITAPQARSYLLGLLIVSYSIILLTVTNAAASTVTREKEDGTLDLLLATPITSRFYIWGKLRGLVSFVLPLIAIPVLCLAMFVLYDLYRSAIGRSVSDQPLILPESLLAVPVTLVILCALAAMVGMHMSLRSRTTVVAVMSAVAIIAGICGALGWCGYGVLSTSRADQTFGMVVGSISPFTQLALLVDPYTFAPSMFDPSQTSPADLTRARLGAMIAAWTSAALFSLAVWWLYTTMVKGFDMTIRRQSR